MPGSTSPKILSKQLASGDIKADTIFDRMSKNQHASYAKQKSRAATLSQDLSSNRGTLTQQELEQIMFRDYMLRLLK